LGVLASRTLALLACSAAAALALATPALAEGESPIPTQSPAETTPPTTYAPGQIIVVWEADASRHDKTAARDGAEVDAGPSLGDPDFQLVEVQPGQSTADALAELRADPAVEIAERNAMLTPAAIPNDTLFGQLWALKNNGAPGVNGFGGAVAGDDINAPAAWDFFNPGLPGTGAVVADIDSGYRFTGPELGPVAWSNPSDPENGIDDDKNGIVDDSHGADFVGANWESPSSDGDPTDDNGISGGHGVHTAGIIGAVGNNNNGVAGVAWDARIMPLRVCANAASPPPPATPNSLACPTSSIINAIKYAGSHGAKVANISLTSTSFSATMVKALGENPQTLFVIAAGNDAKDNDGGGAGQAHYPCNYQPAKESGVGGAIDNVVCVAATNQADQLASFSDWGKSSVDLGAPGTEILSTYPLEVMLSENFQSGGKWTAGPEGGFVAGATEFPLTSPGFSDSPEEPPVPGSTRESTLTTPIALPAGYGNCRLAGKRFVSLRGSETSPGVFSEGSFTYEILANGSPAASVPVGSTSGSTLVNFNSEAFSGLAGTNVQIRFRYAAGPAPVASNGVWLDDLTFTCYQAPNVAPGYSFLQGTSMAAPEVSGTAALLFSIQPSASVTTVRNALLAGVDGVPSLSGKTVTGGRIDAQKALTQLDTTPPGVPQLIKTDPESPGESNDPRIIGSESDSTATVKIYAGTSCVGSPAAQGSAAQLAAPGIAVTVADEAEVSFSAIAVDPAQNASGCSASITYKQKDDKEPPVAPQLIATNPASPSASATSRILGVAEPKSTVRLYSNETCLGAPLATASAEALNSLGIPVGVPSSTTLTFWATATDAAGNISLCSAPISYTNNSLIDPIVNNTQNPPPPSGSCTVPKVVGKTLAQAKAALSRGLCKTGKVTKPKVKPGQKLGALVVKSSSPAAGSVAANGVVSLKLGPKPKARRR
jgi:subtilisin family serine protease